MAARALAMRRPEGMSIEGATQWNRLAAAHVRGGVLTEDRREAFAAFCETIAAERLAAAVVDEQGYVFTDADGNPALRPEAWGQFRAWDELQIYRELYGFTRFLSEWSRR